MGFFDVTIMGFYLLVVLLAATFTKAKNSMKRIFMFFIMSMTLLHGNAQDFDIRESYKYDFVVNLDKYGNAVEEHDCSGIVLFAKSQGKDVVSITMGEIPAYTGIIYSKKQETVKKNTKMTVYLVIQELEGHKIPLQIFEVYDLTKSSYIPDSFIVSICSAKTGEIIQSQAFHNISRVR